MREADDTTHFGSYFPAPMQICLENPSDSARKFDRSSLRDATLPELSSIQGFSVLSCSDEMKLRLKYLHG